MPKKEEVDNIYLTPEQIQEMLDLDLSTKEAVKKRLESLDISEDEKLAQLPNAASPISGHWST